MGSDLWLICGFPKARVKLVLRRDVGVWRLTAWLRVEGTKGNDRAQFPCKNLGGSAKPISRPSNLRIARGFLRDSPAHPIIIDWP